MTKNCPLDWFDLGFKIAVVCYLNCLATGIGKLSSKFGDDQTVNILFLFSSSIFRPVRPNGLVP